MGTKIQNNVFAPVHPCADGGGNPSNRVCSPVSSSDVRNSLISLLCGCKPQA